MVCAHFLVLSSCSQFSRNSPNVFREPRDAAGNLRVDRMRVFQRVDALVQAQRTGAVPRCSLLQSGTLSRVPRVSYVSGTSFLKESGTEDALPRRRRKSRLVVHPRRGRGGTGGGGLTS